MTIDSSCKTAPDAGPIHQVSVVMSVYNGERFIREAVDSILAQTFDDFEFIIIEDGSTDGTSDILGSYSDPRIHVIRQANEGLTASLCTGLELARGEFFARQDADDISAPTRLKRQVGFLERNPQIVAVGTGCAEIDEQGLSLRPKDLALDDRGCKEKLAVASPIVHGSAMIRTRVLREAGGYRTQFRLGQDRDMWLRLSERGMLANLAEQLYLWRVNPTSRSSQERPEQKRISDQALDLAIQRLQLGVDELGESLAYEASKKTLACHQFYVGFSVLAARQWPLGMRLMFGAQMTDGGDLYRWYSLLIRAPLRIVYTLLYQLARYLKNKANRTF